MGAHKTDFSLLQRGMSSFKKSTEGSSEAPEKKKTPQKVEKTPDKDLAATKSVQSGKGAAAKGGTKRKSPSLKNINVSKAKKNKDVLASVKSKLSAGKSALGGGGGAPSAKSLLGKPSIKKAIKVGKKIVKKLAKAVVAG